MYVIRLPALQLMPPYCPLHYRRLPQIIEEIDADEPSLMIFTVLIALPIATQDLYVLEDIDANKAPLLMALVTFPIITQAP
jgi:hypothetical protein